MTERLIIRHFAGLEEVDIELGRINIFIGPQASGKSVCAKCLYWFKSFLPTFLSSAKLGPEIKAFENVFLSRFKEYFPGIWHSDESLFLRYEVQGTFIQLENFNSKLLLTYSPIFQQVAQEIQAEVSALRRRQSIVSSRRFVKTIDPIDLFLEELDLFDKIIGPLQKQVGSMVDNGQLFILAGRSFFAALKGAVLSFLANSPVKDPFLRDFLGKYELSRSHQVSNNHPRTNALLLIAQHILKGRLVVEGNEDFIITASGRRVQLANASSGQQEAFSLILLLIDLVSNDDETPAQGAYTVYVEEPEAHLYPDSQWAMVQLMASVYHESVFSLQYVITTHSPYLLSAFNNLIRAHQLAEQLKNSPEQLKALYRIIPKSQQLALENFRVYALADGKAHSIISAEDGLIVADKLDEVSERISQQFDKLLHLEAQAAADEKAS